MPTWYVNARTVAVDAAAAYPAYLSVEPVSSFMRGAPVTATSSSNVTSMRTLLPMPYVLLAFSDATDETRGTLPSTAKSDEAASVSAPASPDRSSSASLPGTSLIVPPLRDRAVEPWSRSPDSWSVPTAYVNSRLAVPVPDSYPAAPDVPPVVLSGSVGVPFVWSTATGSVNVTLMRIVSPSLYARSGLSDETLATLGCTVSVAISLVRPSEPGSPGAATSVRFTSLPATSFTDPSRALVAL